MRKRGPRTLRKSPTIAPPTIPVAWGELIDKITILEIKSERISDTAAVAGVRRQLVLLREVAAPVLSGGDEILDLLRQLRAINERLWDIENRIRGKEAAGEFDRDFIELARAVYKSNDEREGKKKRDRPEIGMRPYGSKELREILKPVTHSADSSDEVEMPIEFGVDGVADSEFIADSVASASE